MAQIVIQADGPFSVWCNSCERWVAGARLNIDGTHDADESKPVEPQWAKVPRPTSTTHTVWEDRTK